ncbi:MAG TPA: DUF4407 domain-containing protein [Chthoniobacteraceae bacterium]|jgi:hypothetical protein|nr:DUF4407 domain-containing protein [Chthoniobacteraceae bacterium]
MTGLHLNYRGMNSSMKSHNGNGAETPREDEPRPRWDRRMAPLHWLAGCRWDVLRLTPPTERERMAILGATVLIPTALGFFGFTFYVHARYPRLPLFLAVLCAVAWAVVIMNTDRTLIASYRPFQPLYRRVPQIAMRLVLAAFMSTAISYPFCLDQFRPTIMERIRTEHAKALHDAKAERDGLKKSMEDTYHERHQALSSALTTNQSGVINPETYADDAVRAKKAQAAAPDFLAPASQETDRRRQENAALEQQIARLEEELRKHQDRQRRLIDAIPKELNGEPNEFYPDEHKGPGPGTRYKDLLERKTSAGADAAATESKLREARQQWDEAVGNLARLRQADMAEYLAQLESGRAAYAGEAQKKEAARTEQVTALQAQVKKLDEEYTAGQKELEERFTPKIELYSGALNSGDPLTETLGLFRVITTPPPDGLETERVRPAVRWFAGLFPLGVIFGTLFIIDLIPVLTKFLSRPGAYDAMVEFAEMVPRENFAAFRHQYPHYAARWMDEISDFGAGGRAAPPSVADPQTGADLLLACHLPGKAKAAAGGVRVSFDESLSSFPDFRAPEGEDHSSRGKEEAAGPHNGSS